jgi:hypothetical protein
MLSRFVIKKKLATNFTRYESALLDGTRWVDEAILIEQPLLEFTHMDTCCKSKFPLSPSVSFTFM